jgi:hypothetical protein
MCEICRHRIQDFCNATIELTEPASLHAHRIYLEMQTNK